MAKRTDRIGERRLMACGMEAEIIEYNGANDITISFSDGTTRDHVTYSAFKAGHVANPHAPATRQVKSREGHMQESLRMRCGMRCTVTEYRSYSDIDVTFEDGEVARGQTMGLFRERRILHPAFKKATGIMRTEYVSRLPDGTAYYKCECKKCGMRDVLDTQGILSHKCVAKGIPKVDNEYKKIV